MKPGLINRPGKDMLGNEVNRLYTESKLTSMGTTTLHLNNDKKTPYRLATIQFVNAHGEVKTATAQVWEKNAEKVVVGQEYLTEVRNVEGRIYLTLSALTNATYADVDDFDFAAAIAAAESEAPSTIAAK